MKFILGFIAGIILSGSAYVFGLPHCPTEDSCEPVYRHHHGLIHYGYWSGKEVTP